MLREKLQRKCAQRESVSKYNNQLRQHLHLHQHNQTRIGRLRKTDEK
jgi:hypothetical protein